MNESFGEKLLKYLDIEMNERDFPSKFENNVFHYFFRVTTK